MVCLRETSGSRTVEPGEGVSLVRSEGEDDLQMFSPSAAHLMLLLLPPFQNSDFCCRPFESVLSVILFVELI